MGSQNEADLLGCNMRAGIIIKQHLKNDKYIIIIVLSLGTLPGIYNVFQGQGVNIKMVAYLFNNIDFMQSVDVDPGDQRRRFIGK